MGMQPPIRPRTNKGLQSIDIHRLSFATAHVRQDNIVILEIDEGIEVTADMAEEAAFNANIHLNRPFGLLANRKYSYSLSFEAMDRLMNYQHLQAIAFVVYSLQSRLLVEMQKTLSQRIQTKPMEIFASTDAAIDWLQLQLQNTQR